MTKIEEDEDTEQEKDEKKGQKRQPRHRTFHHSERAKESETESLIGKFICGNRANSLTSRKEDIRMISLITPSFMVLIKQRVTV